MNEKHLNFLIKQKKDYSNYNYHDIITKLDYLAAINYHLVDNMYLLLNDKLADLNKLIDNYLDSLNEKR